MSGNKLTAVAPELQSILDGSPVTGVKHEEVVISPETVWMTMRDGVRLATDLYLPPSIPAPAIATRGPYGRARREDTFRVLAQRGYVVVSQDCRGTGDSEPDTWDYYVYEQDDSLDLVEWITSQRWFAGFIGAIGGSYDGETQWCMARHPSMSAIAPEVAALGVVTTTRPRRHMGSIAYSRLVGKGGAHAAGNSQNVLIALDDLNHQMVDETLAGGHFNEPLYKPFTEALLERYPHLRSLPPPEGQRWLHTEYTSLPSAQRAELIRLALGVDRVTHASIEALRSVFGHRVNHDAHILPRVQHSDLVKSLHAPALVVTGWYDHCLDDALATWQLLTRHARESVRSRSRLVISPSAHNTPGYQEGCEEHPELKRIYRTDEIRELLLHWFGAVRQDTLDSWPTVIYYLMGANEWRTASAWPPPEVQLYDLYVATNGRLTVRTEAAHSKPDRYIYDPEEPTPTVGPGSASHVAAPGSVDVSDVQQRSDVLTYTTERLEEDLDVVGPLRLILYVSSSALDTDFSARLSDVFPDGRAIKLQDITLRTRYRNPEGEPELLEPGRIYCLDIDMWATANRFRAGHRIRLDISSADFPKYDRNTNRGGQPGPPIRAEQTIHHTPDHPSHLRLSIIGGPNLGNNRMPS